MGMPAARSRRKLGAGDAPEPAAAAATAVPATATAKKRLLTSHVRHAGGQGFRRRCLRAEGADTMKVAGTAPSVLAGCGSRNHAPRAYRSIRRSSSPYEAAQALGPVAPVRAGEEHGAEILVVEARRRGLARRPG